MYLCMLTVLWIATACSAVEPRDSGQLPWLWRLVFSDTMSTGWQGMPASQSTTAFVEIAGRVVVAVDATTGKERWRAKVGTGLDPAAANIVLSAGRAVVAEVGSVQALDMTTGTVAWSYTPQSYGADGWQSADASTYYLAEREHRVTALDLSAGAVRWSVDIDPNRTSPVRTWATLVAGDTVYVAARQCQDANCVQTRGLVIAFAAADGAELWRYLTPETSMDAFSLALSGRHLVVSDLLGEGLYALDRFTGQRAWRVRGEPHWIGPQAPATVVGDTAYFGMQDQHVYAVHVSTGAVIWKTRVSGGVDGVTACGGSLFATHLGLTKLDRATGRILGTRGSNGDGDSPTTRGGAVSGDRIIVAGNHALYAFSCAK